jgi:hypothetical protein
MNKAENGKSKHEDSPFFLDDVPKSFKKSTQIHWGGTPAEKSLSIIGPFM